MDARIPVGVLGATGMVGAHLVRMLAGHPWFRLAEVVASERSAGQTFGAMLSGGDRDGLSREVLGLTVKSPGDALASPLLLSALPSDVAKSVEAAAAGDGKLVVSNASAFRTDAHVPLVIPEVNPDHLTLIDAQKDRWSGGIVTNPNCVVAVLATALAPLHEAFGLERVVVTTFQAISGAGRPGPAAFDLVDNVLPFIPGEEEKIAAEPRKILGNLRDGAILDADFPVSATAVRVPVLHGHLVSVSCSLRRTASAAEASATLRGWKGHVADLDLPRAPSAPVVVVEEVDRPQPRLDRHRGGGMTVTVGRIRAGEALDLSFVALGHNLVRGAAGASLFNAELCRARGLL